MTEVSRIMCCHSLISIHTSAKEVTYQEPSSYQPDHDFNPHFRKGSDTKTMQNHIGGFDFNPHFRKGSDKKGLDAVITNGISIHTSAKEVTMAYFY